MTRQNTICLSIVRALVLSPLTRELIKEKVRQRADQKVAARYMRRIISFHLDETSPKDVIEDAPAPAPELEQPDEPKLLGAKLAMLHASKVKEAKNSSFFSLPPRHAQTPLQPISPLPATMAPSPSPPPPPPPTQTLAPTVALAAA